MRLWDLRFWTSTPGILIAGGSQRHPALESQALNSQKLSARRHHVGLPWRPPQEARAQALVKERGSAYQHNKQKEEPRESSRSLLLKVCSPSNCSHGSWKPDRKAESWAQPRAAESDATNEILQVTRARPSFSSKCWAHERSSSQRGSAAPTGRSGSTSFLDPTGQSTP